MSRPIPDRRAARRFAEGNKTREQHRAEQSQLAAEMGINDVDLPDAPAAIDAAAPADSLDFDFGLDERPRPDAGLSGEVHEAYAAFDTPGKFGKLVLLP